MDYDMNTYDFHSENISKESQESSEEILLKEDSPEDSPEHSPENSSEESSEDEFEEETKKKSQVNNLLDIFKIISLSLLTFVVLFKLNENELK